MELLILPYLILIAVLTLLTIGSVGLRSRRPKADQCHVCKYPKGGLVGDHCPECGSPIAHGNTEWEWAPPAGIAWGCRLLLASMLTFVVWVSASTHLPHTYRNHAAFSIQDRRGLWRAHIDASGAITAWNPPYYVPRPMVTLTIRPIRGEARTLRILDLVRRAEYRKGNGALVRTSDAVTIADLRDFAQSVDDAEAKGSLNESLQELLTVLQACTTGTDSIEGTTHSHAPAVQYVVPVGVIWSVGLAWVVWFTRPSKRWRIALRRP